MKTFRNVVAVLGILLLLYVGAYWRFARKGMETGYRHEGYSYSSIIEWNNWRKLFTPIASLDYRINVERPFRKRAAGHWKSAESDDFVTLDRDGQCSFLIGEIRHAGKAESWQSASYTMDFVQDGDSFNFYFNAKDENGKVTARASVRKEGTERGYPTTIELSEATFTRASAPD